jgi:hypothetical protein
MADSYQQMLHDVEAVVEDSTPHGVQHDDEHHAPERTYMQGTQDHDRIATWERRDIVIPALAKWMAGLGVVVAIVMVILIGMFAGLMSLERNGDRIPSPVFTERVPPPMPHLYPNPDDAAARKLEPLAGPDDFYHREKAVEDAEATKIGLIDPKTGLAVIPDATAQKVLARSGGQQATQELPRMEMPSEGSGGLRTDNRLR